MTSAFETLSALIDGFSQHDRTALSKIITLIESTAQSAKDEASILLEKIKNQPKKSIRIAVSGPPGVGKSTFINTLGQKLIAKSYKVAILPIDPSSEISAGSILADKTRMKDLLSSADVYIRPSPSKGTLGGIALATKDVIFAVEAFGFDVIIIETVGVGQSETLAKTLSDHFILLMQPGSGDQLQAMKKGILERADFILINKADGAQKAMAEQTESILKMLPKAIAKNQPLIKCISALNDTGVDEVLEKLLIRHEELLASSELMRNREKQLERFFYYAFEQLLAIRLKNIPSIETKCQQRIKDIARDDAAVLPTINRLVEEICEKIVNHS